MTSCHMIFVAIIEKIPKLTTDSGHSEDSSSTDVSSNQTPANIDSFKVGCHGNMLPWNTHMYRTTPFMWRGERLD